ncbi:MAG: hypothetical protein APF81_09585 [Desulfosporosinus sp. BRH_c37]|nr:MAG: hypothetical protein APF81_09585 [Desulfosporosinus sp. BRH_c37]
MILNRERGFGLPAQGSSRQSNVLHFKTEAQFNIHRENMIKAYDELLKMLTALDRTDSEVKEKYRETASMIVENMAKSLKVCRTNLSIDTTQSERG